MTRRQLLAASRRRRYARSGASASGTENLLSRSGKSKAPLTPPELFFVRDHFPQPQLSLETWSLRVEGRVARPYTLTFSDLLELPSKKVEAVLECSGNAPDGSAASNGVWEGVPVSFFSNPPASNPMPLSSCSKELIREA